MTDDAKKSVHCYLFGRKETMKTHGLVLGISVDDKDFMNSKLCFPDREDLKKKEQRSYNQPQKPE